MIYLEYQQFKAATKAHELQQTEDGKRVEIRQLDHEFQCQVNQQFDHVFDRSQPLAASFPQNYQPCQAIYRQRKNHHHESKKLAPMPSDFKPE